MAEGTWNLVGIQGPAIGTISTMAEKRAAESTYTRTAENGSSPPCKKVMKTDRQTGMSPLVELKETANRFGLDILSDGFAKKMDELDQLAPLREEFIMPKMKELPDVDLSLVNKEDECIYFCGNSLGLQPKGLKFYFDAELEKWAKIGVHGHLCGQMPWAFCDEVLATDMSNIVGCKEEELAIMNGLTVNLHLLMMSFYRPTEKRHKILIESKAFPSDHYTVESQIRLNGYDPATSIIFLEPRKGEYDIRTEDVLSVIEKEGDGIAVILLGALQYYTGQFFNMPVITKAGHAKGCYVGFDLAHAVGNVELHLHDWDVDFAVWCTYKYLNSGAGSLGGAFLHSKLAHTMEPKLVGWWGHKFKSRFDMNNELELSPGISGYRLSNPSIFAACPLRASLDVFRKTSMSELRAKSVVLTGYLEYLVGHYFGKDSPHRKNKEFITILTPSNPEERGAQLSLYFSIPINRIHSEMGKRGIVCDERKPNVIRIAPAPVYCNYLDVWRFIDALQSIMDIAENQPDLDSELD
ncbi:kynureninase-like isoform X1 [Lytechinus variegatus]|uniref:kynureninase-like isoform X1 n=2 Tax=Lytechinus variegatus TaxID=7654 RepID=UPI001BB214A0|nr:kynureninase-like isoform X1 [Lytechinus variegatus]